jgi:hypothetical protein
MSVSELRNLDSESLEGLSSLDVQLQTLLKPVYERVVESIDEDDDTPEGKRQRLADLQTRSACTTCRELLAQRAEALRQIVPVPPVDAAPPLPPAAQPS